MILWIIAISLFAVLGLIGYYQGAIRVAFSFAGIVAAAALAFPLAGIVKSVLPAFGLSHPVLLAFLAPAIIYLLVLIGFKSAALAAHKSVTTHYKYKTSDTQRLLWSRLNERLGICLGMANAAAYLVLLGIVFYVLGYCTIQVATSDKDSWMIKAVNTINQDMKATGFDKVVAPLSPATPAFYDAMDVLGVIFHNPLLQSRLSTYPVFLTLAERPEFKEVGNNVAFQEFWQKAPSVAEFVNHEKMKPLIENTVLYKEIATMLGGDTKDLNGYLETGKSAKYDDEKILGRWDFDPADSMKAVRKKKPNLNSVEITRLRKVFRGTMAKATLMATIDSKVFLKIPSVNNTTEGTWKAGTGGQYILTLTEGGRNVDVQASVEGTRVTVVKDGFTYVFGK